MKLTRRGAIKIPAALLTAGAQPALSARAAQQDQGQQAMTIERYGPTPSLAAGIPLINLVVVHRDLVYVSGITASPGTQGDVAEQTHEVLTRIDTCLAKAGTNKSNLLSAQIWLTDMANFAAHNDAWNAWVDAKNAPARACLHSPRLWRPEMLVEIMVTAAK